MEFKQEQRIKISVAGGSVQDLEKARQVSHHQRNFLLQQTGTDAETPQLATAPEDSLDHSAYQILPPQNSGDWRKRQWKECKSPRDDRHQNKGAHQNKARLIQETEAANT